MIEQKFIPKTSKQINNMRTAGSFLTEMLTIIRNMIEPGLNLLEIEKTAEVFLKKNKLKGSFLGYQGFPANLCLSVNDCIVHGIPDDTVLKKGDLLKIDAGVTYDGLIADSAISVVVGGNETNHEARDLIKTTKKALNLAVSQTKHGFSLYDFAIIVYNTVHSDGYRIIENLTGHGVGESVHEFPYVFNYPNSKIKGQFFKEGMTVALEPITAMRSTCSVTKPGNNRNLYTQKGDLGAQREYTVLITKDGCEILAGINEE